MNAILGALLSIRLPLFLVGSVLTVRWMDGLMTTWLFRPTFVHVSVLEWWTSMGPLEVLAMTS